MLTSEVKAIETGTLGPVGGIILFIMELQISKYEILKI